MKESEKRLLVIDDDLEFRRFIDEFGRTTDYDVTVVADAAEFRWAYARTDPTVIILDIVMPGVDGFEMMQWLVQQNCRAKVVIVTGYNPHYAEMAKTIGADWGRMQIMTLTKPVGLRELRGALDLPTDPR